MCQAYAWHTPAYQQRTSNDPRSCACDKIGVIIIRLQEGEIILQLHHLLQLYNCTVCSANFTTTPLRSTFGPSVEHEVFVRNPDLAESGSGDRVNGMCISRWLAVAPPCFLEDKVCAVSLRCLHGAGCKRAATASS